MGPLAGFERFLERLFERPSARLFGARLQPVQLQRRLERAMENERLTSAGRTHVPNRYAVHLSPEDFAQFQDLGQALAGELADAALAYARQHHYTLADRPQVSLEPDEKVALGEILVAARFSRVDGSGAERFRGPQHAEQEIDRPVGDGADAEAGDSGRNFGDTPGGVPDRTMVFEVPRIVSPRARLKLVTPDGGQRDVDVHGAPVTIGRATDNDLVVRDGRASRHHARLQARSGALVLTDLGSTNGTRVNGTWVQEVALGVGDRIEIGDSLLVVEVAPER